MDHVLLFFIILSLIWTYGLLRFLKIFKKFINLKRQEFSLKVEQFRIKNERDNSTLQLQNDLRGVFLAIYRKYFDVKKKKIKKSENGKSKKRSGAKKT